MEYIKDNIKEEGTERISIKIDGIGIIYLRK
jgi:hypothetical protein